MKGRLSALRPVERSLAAAALVAVCAAAGYNWIAAPAFRKYAQLDLQAAVAVKTIRNDEALIRDRESIERSMRDFAAASVPAGNSPEVEGAALLKEVDALAQSNSVRVLDLKPVMYKKVETCTEYRLELTAESDLDSLMAFFYHIERSNNLLSVSTFRISASPDNPAVLRATVLLTKSVV